MNVEKTAGDKASYQESDPLSGKTVDSDCDITIRF